MANNAPLYTGRKCRTCGCTTKVTANRECVNKCYLVRRREYRDRMRADKKPVESLDITYRASSAIGAKWRPEVIRPWPVHDLSPENLDLRNV
jgi:hypothetical protein